MVTAAFGESHSLQRYAIFGVIAGVVAGSVAVAFGLSLPLVAAPAAAIAALAAGAGRRSDSEMRYYAE